MTVKNFTHQTFGSTNFEWNNEVFKQTELFGFDMNPNNISFPYRLSQFFDLSISLGMVNEKNAIATYCKQEGDHLEIEWDLYNGEVKWNSKLDYYSDLGIWKRSDQLINTGKKDVTIFRALANYVFLPDEYEVFYQTSRWCYENDGQWQPLQPVKFECEGGRTTQGATPFLALRKKGGSGIAFHIIPKGNWEMAIQTPSPGVGNPSDSVVQVQLGQRSNKLQYTLSPGEAWELPEFLIQSLPSGMIHESSPNLHRYFLLKDSRRHDKVHPIVYNPWFDNYAMLDNTERLRKHLQIAKKLGCEVFEIDAGWYGAEKGDWWQQAGDWRERLDGAFKGKMKEFVKEVHDAGLQFGLWMEPERVGENVPIRREKPEWFAWGNGFYYPKLHLPEVYTYIYSEIARLIETYELKWMKFDFNFELGEDELGTNYYSYYKAWYNLIEDMRNKYPDTFLEGCAAGGQRTDINTVLTFDGHFLSDNVNPWDTLRVYQQGLLRLPPYRLIKWLVIQPGAKVSLYGSEQYEQHSTVTTPAPPGAGFDQYERIDLNFACLMASSGMFGLSGNFVDFEENQLEEIKKHLDFYKKWRDFFKESVVYQNEDPKPIGNRKGFVTLQYFNEENKNSLLYIYKLKELRKTYTCNLKGINESDEYQISSFDGEINQVMKGEDLMKNGIPITLDREHTAKLIIVERVSE